VPLPRTSTTHPAAPRDGLRGLLTAIRHQRSRALALAAAFFDGVEEARWILAARIAEVAMTRSALSVHFPIRDLPWSRSPPRRNSRRPCRRPRISSAEAQVDVRGRLGVTRSPDEDGGMSVAADDRLHPPGHRRWLAKAAAIAPGECLMVSAPPRRGQGSRLAAERDETNGTSPRWVSSDAAGAGAVTARARRTRPSRQSDASGISAPVCRRRVVDVDLRPPPQPPAHRTGFSRSNSSAWPQVVVEVS